MSFPTVCQFDDSMMIECNCHCEGLMVSYDKDDKELFLNHWTTSTNSGIFSHNFRDAFYYLFTGKDRTIRITDLDRNAVYELACYINKVLKLKKIIKEKPQTDNTYSLGFYINGKDNTAVEILNHCKDEKVFTLKLVKKVGVSYSTLSKWETFWRILFKGTSGVNWITIEKFESEMFLDYLIDQLRYSW